jgi:hypothetical protein
VTAFALGAELRRRLRPRLSRHPTLRVYLRDRAVVRSVYHDVGQLLPGSLAELRIIPISSMEWTSELRRLEGAPIIVFDVEEANALSFFLTRQMNVDRPIFHYVEHIIRAGEFLLSLGEGAAGLRIGRLGQYRLAQYAATHGTSSALPRPIDLDGAMAAPNMVMSGIIPSFVLGHEIGHYLADYTSHYAATFESLAELWEELSTMPSTDGANPRLVHPRFVHPANLQKLDSSGRPAGHAVLSMHMMTSLQAIQRRMISESQADFVGLLAATAAAARLEIPPVLLLQILRIMLEGMERQLLLRQIATRLPRRPERAGIMIDGSRAGSRIRMLLEVVRRISARELADPATQAYWAQLPELDRFESSQLDSLTFAAERSQIVARGAIYYGLGGPPPTELYTPEQARSKFGLLAGNMISISAPFYLPDGFYDLASHADWSPHPKAVEPALAGFAAAIRDMTQALVHSAEADEASGHLWQIEEMDLESALERVRQARINVRQYAIPYPNGKPGDD